MSVWLGSLGLVTAIVITQLLLEAIVPRPALDASRGQSELQRHALDIVVWLIAPIAAGALYRNHKAAAYIGVLTSLVTFLLLGSTRADLPQGEWSSFGRVIENAVLIGYAFLAAFLVLLGAGLGAMRSRRALDRARSPQAVYAIANVAAIALALTLAMSTWLPDDKAYAIELSPEWVVARYHGFDPTYGTDFTAELGPTERPTYYTPPTHPVVGVSVVSLTASPSPFDCFRAFGPWPGNPMLAQTQRIRAGDANLPLGPAYEWIGKREGLTFYSYSFGRERRILFDSRELCYMLVITLPDTAGMTEADALAIAESFRYR